MTIEMDIVEKPDFKRIDKTVTNTFNRSTSNLVTNGAKYMRGIVPHKTGNLRNSIKNDKNDIWTNADHFKYVDEGTRPHIIEGLLRFIINGAVVFARDVHHPGTKAQHLSDKTITHIEKNIPNVVKDIDRVTR